MHFLPIRQACILALAVFTATLAALAQNNIGIGTTTPAASAQLDVFSTTKGVLVPRVTTAQMNAIASPANGLLVYNTTASAFAYRTTSGWVFLTGNATAANGWSTLGNAGTNPASNFFGTTDNQPVMVRQNNVRAGLLTGSNTSWGVNALNPASTGIFNTANGVNALRSNTTGNNNTAIGESALFSNTTGNSNTANGFNALGLNTQGSSNTANGMDALLFNTTGGNNTANGAAALRNNTEGGNNTANGMDALLFNTTGGNNTANGAAALRNNTEGGNNTANGLSALHRNTTGFSNVAVGISALFSNTTISNLVAIGDSALYNNGVGATDNEQAIGNTAVGSKALYSNTTGYSNTANGFQALYANTIGIFNTAHGANALRDNTEGSSNTANGVEALVNNSLGSNNTANGFRALRKNTTGNNNTANGVGALIANTSGSNNTANGLIALASNTTGSNNTANGVNALGGNTTGFSNVAVGIQALRSNTTRGNLVAIGDSALYNNGLGASGANQATANTALGSKALYTNTTGYHNTANGYQALYSNTGGDANTAMGREALFTNQGGYSNTAMGNRALYSNASGIANTALGYQAGYSNVAGSGSVFIGHNAGFNETGNNKLYINNDGNTALMYGEFDTDKLQVNNKLGIGRLPATYPLEIQALGSTNELLKFFTTAGTERWHINLLSTGSLNFVETNVADNRLVLGNGGEVGVGKIPLTGINDSRLHVKQKGAQNGIGIEASGSANHWDFYVNTGASSDLQLYYNGSPKGTFGNAGGVYTPSDKRLKKDIATYEPILNKLHQLEAFHYHYLDNKSTDPLSTGFMAQDVQKIFPDAVNETEMKNGEKMLGINYQYFTVVAIKGLQEQQEMIAKQEERIAKLEALIKTIAEKK